MFLESLGIGRLIRIVFSQLVGSSPICDVFVIYRVSRRAEVLARLLGLLRIPVRLREVDFDFIDDVRLPGIPSVREHIYYKVVPQLLEQIESDSHYRDAVEKLAQLDCHRAYLSAYVSKSIFFELPEGIRSILIAAWYSRSKLDHGAVSPALYLQDSWCFGTLSEYASQWGIKLRPINSRKISFRFLVHCLRSFLQKAAFSIKGVAPVRMGLEGMRLDDTSAVRIAAEMYSNGIKQEPIYNTEFFWCRGAKLPAGAVFGYFALSLDQPTGARQSYLKNGGIGWVDRVALNRLMEKGRFWKNNNTRFLGQQSKTLRSCNCQVHEAMGQHAVAFYAEYGRWRRFVDSTATRIHVSTYDIFPESEARHAALADIGGVSVSIQRSIEREPYTLRRAVTDVHFAFSQAQAKLEQLSGSTIEQFIAAGYIFDAAFPAAREHAQQLVSKLRSCGVVFTVSFFDEHHGAAPKKVGGRRLTQQDYSFLCDRLTEDPTLGLILKPKRPETLPGRLGPVWERVQHFIDSGRCVFLDGESLDDRYLPCVAACASDLAIGMLEGGTAALESYLAGTRTVMLRHCSDLGLFERLPRGAVVFNNWEDLWVAVRRYRADRNDPQIGNWEPVIDALAFPRDGRASERIASYIAWLYEALATGKSRAEAMERAGGLYAGKWGDDLVRRIAQPDSRETRGDSCCSGSAKRSEEPLAAHYHSART